MKILIREVADRERALAYFLREQVCGNNFQIQFLAHIINIIASVRAVCLPGTTAQEPTLPTSSTCTCRYAGFFRQCINLYLHIADMQVGVEFKTLWWS